MYKLGEQISHARKMAGITQEKLADELIITRQTISSWERDKSQPDIEFVIKLSKILNYRFMIEDGVYISTLPGSSSSEDQQNRPCYPGLNPGTRSERKKQRFSRLISFTAGILAALLIMLCITPLFKTDQVAGYNIVKNEGGKTGPATIHWFKEAEAPHKGKPYVVISFSENPVYAHANSDFANGVGWKYTVYLTEYNGYDFYPDSYTMYYFKDEDDSVSTSYTAEDLDNWWGESLIPSRGQQCISSGDPLQNIIGIGFELAGKDAGGEEMVFRGYMECSQEIKE